MFFRHGSNHLGYITPYVMPKLLSYETGLVAHFHGGSIKTMSNKQLYVNYLYFNHDLTSNRFQIVRFFLLSMQKCNGLSFMILTYKYPEIRLLNCSNAKNALKATCSVYAPLKYIKKKSISLCQGGEMLILQTANRPALAHRHSHNLQNKNRISWMFEIRCLHLSFFI